MHILITRNGIEQRIYFGIEEMLEHFSADEHRRLATGEIIRRGRLRFARA